MAKKSGKSGPDEFMEISDDNLWDIPEEPVAIEEIPEVQPAPKVANPALEIPLPTEVILKSKAFKGYQRDFAKSLLNKPLYTVSEAKKILDNYFNRKDGV